MFAKKTDKQTIIETRRRDRQTNRKKKRQTERQYRQKDAHLK